MPHVSRSSAIRGLAACLFVAVAGCGNPEVGSIEEVKDPAEATKSTTEGRFKETVPAKPARSKTVPGKSTVDEGIETR